MAAYLLTYSTNSLTVAVEIGKVDEVIHSRLADRADVETGLQVRAGSGTYHIPFAVTVHLRVSVYLTPSYLLTYHQPYDPAPADSAYLLT